MVVDTVTVSVVAFTAPEPKVTLPLVIVIVPVVSEGTVAVIVTEPP